MQTEEIKQKLREAFVEKYDVENPMQNPDYLNRHQIAAFKRKIYKTASPVNSWHLQEIHEHLTSPQN